MLQHFHQLVAVSMESKFMALVTDLGHLLWKRLHGVSGHKPGRTYFIAIEQFEQPVDTNGRSEYATGHICWIAR